MLLPLLALLGMQGTHTVVLYRGAEIEGVKPRYWEVEDTTLDSTQADLNLGWQPELDGGEGKSILIQFKGLERVLGPHKKITRASLLFSITSGDRVALTSVGEVVMPWNQGPVKAFSIGSSIDDVASLWSATWRKRRSGTVNPNWEHAGALGSSDTKPIAAAKFSQPDNDHVEIDGLEEAIQREYDQPSTNHGFMLKFAAPIGLVSSEFYQSRPHLVVEYQDEPAASGPDLDVTYIERKPEYARYRTAGGFTTQPQDGVPIAVLDHPLDAFSKKWPVEGDDLTYIAHVRNSGNAPAHGFSCRWYLDETPGTATTVAQTLQPGEETTVTIHRPFKLIPADHRTQPLGFEVFPNDPDAVQSNNFLDIQESALNVGVSVEKSLYDKFAGQYGASFEDWMQGQIGLLNNVYFPFSRFSFATDGVRERLRIQRIQVVPDGSLHQSPNDDDMVYDATLNFGSAEANEFPKDARDADLPLLRQLCLQLGVPDWSAFSFPAGDPKTQAVGPEGTVSRGTEDLYPGLMGGGDTRDEAALQHSFSVGYQPYKNPMVEELHLEPTDLLSATDVAQLNSDIGKRRGFAGDALYDTPTGTAIQVVDYNGNPVPKVKLTFYQMVNGEWSKNSPAFSLAVKEKAPITLFKRDTQAGNSLKLLTGHELRPNPFGRIDTSGNNGMFMVRAEANGVTEWAPFKLWQLVDSDHRGQASFALMTFAVNLPSDPLDVGNDVAKGKLISSSDTSAKVPSLLDGTNSAEVSLPSATGSWVEIDLGRDRTVGEVRLATKSGEFWKQFEIRAYQTAQKPTDALLWASESNWSWSYRNRPDMQDGVKSVAYRGSAQRVRFIRIINTGPAAVASLVGIQVTAIKQ